MAYGTRMTLMRHGGGEIWKSPDCWATPKRCFCAAVTWTCNRTREHMRESRRAQT